LAWRETDDRDRTRQIRIYDLAKKTTATVMNVAPGSLVWSPDGQLLTFPVETQLKPNSCDYQIDIYTVKPDASGLRNLTEGQQMKSLPCSFSGGMGWRWYDRFVKDVQWVLRPGD
jgi:Tol biopolymer transport system component